MTLPKYNPLFTPYTIVKNGKAHIIMLTGDTFLFAKRNGKTIRTAEQLYDLSEYFSYV